MTTQHSPMRGTFALTSLTTSAAIALLGLSLIPISALANTRTSTLTTSFASLPIKISQSFRPRSRGTAPPSAGGATRGDSCLKGSQQLTSLIPQSRLGVTYSSNPTFYWYVPQSSATTAKFLLLTDDDTEVVYETELKLPSESGIVSLTLPDSAPPLVVGKQYHWYLVVGCNQQDQSANPSVEGWVERITPEGTIKSQLEKASPQEKALIYATNGIWHEAIATLAGLRHANPTDATVTAGWRELLRSVNLERVANAPLMPAKLRQN